MSDETKEHYKQSGKTISLSMTWIYVVVLLIVFGLGGFFGGIQYEKGHETSISASQRLAGGSYGGGGFGQFDGQRPTFGTVTAISATSISIDNSRTGSTSTFAITSSTSITDNGQSASLSSIQTGDTVIVIASSSNSSDASRIMVNPSFGGNTSGSQTGSTTN
jgi:hypothetical protein